MTVRHLYALCGGVFLAVAAFNFSNPDLGTWIFVAVAVGCGVLALVTTPRAAPAPLALSQD